MILAATAFLDYCGEKWWQNWNDSRSGNKPRCWNAVRSVVVASHSALAACVRAVSGPGSKGLKCDAVIFLFRALDVAFRKLGVEDECAQRMAGAELVEDRFLPSRCGIELAVDHAAAKLLALVMRAMALSTSPYTCTDVCAEAWPDMPLRPQHAGYAQSSGLILSGEPHAVVQHEQVAQHRHQEG
jgi:hypothetical protein